MKKSILILFCILAANIAFTQWEWQYPVPQGNNLNDIFFINHEVGWAVGNIGTIIKSEDGGLSYEVIYYPTYSNLRAVEFFDLYTGFAVGDSATILKTINGGITWESIELGLSENHTDISLTSPEKVWITGDNGTLLYSEDMGESWETQFSDTALILNSVCFIDEFHGWIAARNSDIEDILLHTSDGGVSWNQIYSSITFRWCVYFFDTLNGYGYDQSTVMQTTDGGISWEVIFSTSSFYGTYITSAMFTDPDHAWITTSNYMSPDGIIYTHNGFESWDWANFEGSDSQLLYCAFFTDNVNGWAAGSGGNLAKTTDGGINWVVISTSTDNTTLHDVFFTDSTNGWAVGGGNSPSTPFSSHLLHTYDGGNSWNNLELPPAVLTSVFFVDPLEGWIGGFSGGDTVDIFHTNDGGASWEKQSVLFESNPNVVKDMWFIDAQHGWVVGGKFNHLNPPGPPLLLNTVNGGESWEDRSYITDKSLSAVCFFGQNDGWMAGNEVILHTTDGGQNWEEQVTEYTLRDIYFVDNENGWAVGDSMTGNWQIEDKGIVMRTTDGGGSWEVTSFDQWFRFYKVFFTDLSHGWIVGWNDLLYTNDGGISWTPQFINTSFLNSIYFINQYKGWVVGHNCSILHTNNGGILNVEENQPIVNGIKLDVKSYPNPFSSNTTIEYTLEDPCMVILRIFNSFGQMVDIPVKEFQFRGEQKVIWDAEGMPAGMYYYSVTAGNSAGCGKLVVK